VAELQTLDQLKSQFMAVMSHELLTPINFIVGFGSALEDELLGPLNDKQHETMGKMLAGAERLTRMVRNTLEYSQLQAGKLEYLPQTIDYAEVLQNVRDGLADRLAKRGQTLDVTLPDGPVDLWADPDRARQILDELLDNASKFSPDGARLRLCVTVGDDVVTTEIADSGVGIPENALPHLFTPFYQVDFSRTREHGGMGLGLAIAYHLVARMGGSMLVSSEPGAGTTITFTLPRFEKAAQSGMQASGVARG
jgi:signal transduction histidine kinase